LKSLNSQISFFLFSSHAPKSLLFSSSQIKTQIAMSYRTWRSSFHYTTSSSSSPFFCLQLHLWLQWCPSQALGNALTRNLPTRCCFVIGISQPIYGFTSSGANIWRMTFNFIIPCEQITIWYLHINSTVFNSTITTHHIVKRFKSLL
jgi:hypothetical protein